MEYTITQRHSHAHDVYVAGVKIATVVGPSTDSLYSYGMVPPLQANVGVFKTVDAAAKDAVSVYEKAHPTK
jgi:hypothetical protein